METYHLKHNRNRVLEVSKARIIDAHIEKSRGYHRRTWNGPHGSITNEIRTASREYYSSTRGNYMQELSAVLGFTTERNRVRRGNASV